jgi:23S rRNA pseudouridine2605 synthase
MKQSGTTIIFLIVCIGVLLAAYGIGIGIREIRFRGAKVEPEAVAGAEKPANEPPKEQVGARSRPARGTAETPEPRPSSEEGARPGADRMMGMRERFENMSEEEREKAIAEMRERFGGRRREGGPQLSEEDRAKMREELEELRARSEEMSEEEREKARAQIFEKYGISPRGSGGRPGGGRSFGGGEGGRRRPGGRQGAGQREE